MILIHRLKKTKPKKAIIEIVWDILFFVLFFALGTYLVFMKVQDREERAMVVSDMKPVAGGSSNSTSSVKAKFVASSRGKYFYLVGSNRANSLSEKNKVFFDTEEEAKKQGFKPYIGN